MTNKQRELRSTWMAMVQNIRHMERTVLSILRHSDATPECIPRVVDEYKKVYASAQEREPAVRDILKQWHYPLRLTNKD